ncbi:MAG: alpha/beta hydrolase [Methylococcaceae bacterium]|nr:alpha/beta hydrolase [Methylococcaceae bacterium]
MEVDFVISTRRIVRGEFGSEPGSSRYLIVPREENPQPGHGVSAAVWVNQIQSSATWGEDPRRGGAPRGDILFFVHGFNNTQQDMIRRHRLIEANLKAKGFKGVVASFDWPSAGVALNYLEDRHDAKQVAGELVDGGIRMLAKGQQCDCSINVHTLGHSTGAYVIREAFDDADDTALDNNAWIISQTVFVAGDVSSDSLSASNPSSEALYRHSTRVTNYSNRFDSVLKLSNAKRVGLAPRAGRVGLPPDPPDKAVNVDCSDRFEQQMENAERDSDSNFDRSGHSWYFNDPRFYEDLLETLKGDVDRDRIPTRRPDAQLGLVLRTE